MTGAASSTPRTAAPHPDGRVERGNQSRRLILERTVETASVEGLDALSLGRLATELGLSKSGVFALFGSKEELQLATVRAAVRIFAQQVVQPTLDLPPGVERLRRLCAGWLEYSRSRVFAGGCFFYAVSAEYDARTGPVHDAVAATQRDWAEYVAAAVRDAVAAGSLAADTDPVQLAFELIAVMESANGRSVLHGDDTAYRLAETAIRNRLAAAAR